MSTLTYVGTVVAASHGGLDGQNPEAHSSRHCIEADWARRIQKELIGNILPFWMNYSVDRENGGFYGLVDTARRAEKNAARSSVLNTRILWTFSAATHALGGAYREISERAFTYLMDKFWDHENEGLFWMLDCQGNPVSTRKQTYGQAFGIYALAEFHRATGSAKALERAMRLFQLIEEHSRDRHNGGYREAFGYDWRPLEDMRLSEKDLNCPKSMNTHLHVLEAYTSLLRVTGDAEVHASLADLVNVFVDRIADASAGHLKLFFDEQWKSLSGNVSYGHDIEASWLLVEAAEMLGDEALIARSRDLAIALANSVYRHGLGRDGGVSFEADAYHAVIDGNKHWWVQAEAVVGFYNAYQICGDQRFLDASRRVWDYIETKVVDRIHGEWHAKLSPEGRPLTEREDPDVCLAGPWKCPYHNARACFEMLARLADS